ncbi:MAG: ABC transporter permease, partial [Bacteroidota bacterium]
MLLHAWRIAFRNLLRHKIFAFINLTGLGIGVACCLLLMLYVQYEMSYDSFHPEGDQVYRMALERIYPEHETFYAIIPHSIGEATQAELPEVEAVCRIMPGFGTMVLQKEDQFFEEDKHLFADSNFFQIFGIELLSGQPNQVLKGQNSVVLTEAAAQRYFGNEDPVGQTIQANFGANFGSMQVTGVCENVPAQSHIAFEMLISLNSMGFIRTTQNYLSFSTLTYLKLKEGTDPAHTEAKFPGVIEAYAAGQIQRNLGVSFEDYQAAGNGYHYFLQPLQDIHLDSHLEAEIQPNGNRNYVYLFLSIALFILLIACINFMNLATARSAERAKEVGMRKVLGSHRSSLILQFLLESIFLAGVSVLLALAIIRFGLPFFNEASGKALTMEPFTHPLAMLGLLG